MSEKLQKALESYENYIRNYGITLEVINAYSEAANIAINSEKNVPLGLKITRCAKEIAEKYILEKTNGTVWELEKYSFESGKQFDVLELYYGILLLEAQNKVVDSFFRYIEKNRLPKDRVLYATQEATYKNRVSGRIAGND